MAEANPRAAQRLAQTLLSEKFDYGSSEILYQVSSGIEVLKLTGLTPSPVMRVIRFRDHRFLYLPQINLDIYSQLIPDRIDLDGARHRMQWIC